MVVNGTIYFANKMFNADLTKLNIVTCKLKSYLVYVNGAISPWLMVVVSIDRYLSIGFPKRFPLFFKIKLQLGIIFTIIIFNYCYYSLLIWSSFLLQNNNTVTDNTTENNCVQVYGFAEIQYMDLINSTILPFLFMIVFSIGLIQSVRSSRARVRKTTGSSSLSSRDVRFAITAISLNVIFLVLNLPIVIEDLYVISVTPAPLFDYFSYVTYYLYYTIEFYVLIVVNREFRREFVKLMIRVNTRTLGNIGFIRKVLEYFQSRNTSGNHAKSTFDNVTENGIVA